MIQTRNGATVFLKVQMIMMTIHDNDDEIGDDDDDDSEYDVL